MTTNRTFPDNLEKYKELLQYNFQGKKDFSEEEILKEFALYEQAIIDWSNYPDQIQRHGLSLPCDGGVHWIYPDIHPFHRTLCSLVKETGVESVLEIGACVGQAIKYVGVENPGVKLSCLEGSKVHLELLRETFDKDLTQFLPKVDLDVEIIEGIAQDIPLEDNSRDFVFTNTVTMHIPFYAAIEAIREIYRVSNKYICHIERKDGNIVMGRQQSNNNLLNVDYKALYESLGVETLVYQEFPYPKAEYCKAIVYLGLKK